MAALAAGGVALAAEALDVRDELQAAKSQLAAVPELVKAGDTAQFEQAADEVLAHTSSADEIVQGPLWSFASAVPFVGQNIAAMRDVTEATHILVRDALPPSFGVLSAVQADKIRFEGGGFNLEALRGALAALPAIDEAFTAAQQKVEGIDRSGLLPIVDDAIGQVLDVIVDTAPLVHSATRSAPHRAADARRDRASHLLRDVPEQRRDPRHGRQSRRRGPASRRGGPRLAGGADRARPNSRPAASADGSTSNCRRRPWRCTSGTSRCTRRTTPGPRTSRRRRACSRGSSAATRGQAVDGVISLDPVALSHMLAVAGPVTVDGIEINAGNAVSVLLNETYWRFPGRAGSLPTRSSRRHRRRSSTSSSPAAGIRSS